MKRFLKSERFRELFVYLVVGLLTTAVNYAVYFLITRGFAAALKTAPDSSALMLAGTIVGWFCSVAFAFWANKKYVFRSAGWDKKTLARELPGFVAARLFSLAFDAAFIELAVNLLGMNDLVAKLVSNILIVIINYFLSKFWIFRKRDASDTQRTE